MTQEKAMPSEETLDPQDWESMQALGHRMLDDMPAYRRTVRERSAWQHASDEVKAHFDKPLPLDPQPPEGVYAEFLEYVLPYPVGNIHPRFWGWVIGTGTVLGALAELLAAAMNTNPRPDPRHRIEHAVITKPESTQRMRDLGVVVSTQPQFIRIGGDGYADLFGEERARRAIVTREWLDNGVVVALGSDSPTTPWYTPLATLIGAVTRITFSNQFYEPDQAMTIQEALRAHTMGAAYAAHEEDIKGSIEAGKLADLAVWSDDPYTVTIQQLWEFSIVMTLVGGEVVHQTGEITLTPTRAWET
jgi:hypothetical protein